MACGGVPPLPDERLLANDGFCGKDGHCLQMCTNTLVGLPDSNRKYQDSGHTVLDKINESQNKAKICMWENVLVGGKWESGQNIFIYYELDNEQISMEYVKTEKWGLECKSVT